MVKAHCATNTSYTENYEPKEFELTTDTQTKTLSNNSWKGKTVYCKMEVVNNKNEKADVVTRSIYMSN